MTLGYLLDEVCNRNGCKGIIEEHSRDGSCSCHINPPCASCMESREFCPVCDWQGADEEWPKYAATEYFWLSIAVPKPRALDPTKIDYRVTSHTNSSQLCTGVYPDGTSRAEVEKIVKGTFGGRFNHFGNGRFEYVAYTD